MAHCAYTNKYTVVYTTEQTAVLNIKVLQELLHIDAIDFFLLHEEQ